MVRLLTAGDMAEVTWYLQCNYIETVVLAGNIERYGLDNNRTSRRSGDYYGYFENSRLKGIMAFYNLGSVILHAESLAAISCFSEIMRRRRYEIIAGMRRTIEPLADTLSSYKKIEDYEESYCLINKRARLHPMPDAGRVLDSGEIDKAAALTFVVEAFRVGFKRRFNTELAARLIEERGPGEDLVFLLIEGIPKAQAMVQAAADQACQIGSVFTDEKSRGKGYCKVLVAELCRRVQERGKVPVLMVQKDNRPAIKAYEAAGFSYFDDYLVLKMKL